jgi:hypothetical protein
MQSALAQGKASEIVIMSSIVTANVAAASAGLLPLLRAAPWEGRIAAVFHHGVLLTTSDERLLHLHAGPRLVSPFSLRIEEPFARMLRNIPLAPGMPVRQTGPAIEIAEHLRLGLDGVTYYQSPKPSPGEIDSRAVQTAHQLLGSQGRTGGLDALPGMQTIFAAIQQALAAGDLALLGEATRGLIGLGPGLTPSGDDSLVGCLRGLWLMSEDEAAAREMLAYLGHRLLPGLGDRTTQVGAEFIRYALDGTFAEILDHAAEALMAPTNPQRVQFAVTRLLAQGDTSGTETTRGLLTCIDATLSCSSSNRSRGSAWAPPVAVTSAGTQG